MKAELTQARLKELLHYDPETGVFTWLVDRGLRRDKGKVAGNVRPDGYVGLRVDGVNAFAHRLAFLYMMGVWPAFHVDHINGVKADNRWENLRDVPRTLNMQNRSRPYKSSKTGVLGVAQTGRRFTAAIRIGTYDTAEEAHAAYVAAKALLHPGFVPPMSAPRVS